MLANFDFASMPELAAPFPAAGPDGPLIGSSTVNGASSSTGATGKPPIPLACVACRSKHLKCTGGEPCSRCATDGSECSYVKSRRVKETPHPFSPSSPHLAMANDRRRDTRARGRGLLLSSWRDLSHESRVRTGRVRFTPQYPVFLALTVALVGSATGLPTAAAFSTCSGQQSQSQSQSPSFSALDALLTGGCQASSSPAQMDCFAFQPVEDRAVAVAPKQATLDQMESNDSSMATSAFFTYFATAHPFLLPRQYLLDLLRNKRLPHLELAVQYIGSCYLTQVSTQSLEDALSHALLHQNLSRDGFMVQALLLYAIGLKSTDKCSMADEVLNQAIDIALAIGMNDREFSISNGSGSRVMEESWRRTWWEVYVVDGFFAGVSNRTSFRLWGVLADVPLPCEEAEYASGVSVVLPSRFMNLS